MSSKTSTRNNRKKQKEIKGKEETNLNVVSPELKKKEIDTPLYLVRYDD